MSTPRERLERWMEGAPDALRDCAREALERAHASGSDAERMGSAALERLGAVLESSGDRAAALDLLAADALLTHACESAAAEGPDALEAFTRRLIERIDAIVAGTEEGR